MVTRKFVQKVNKRLKTFQIRSKANDRSRTVLHKTCKIYISMGRWPRYVYCSGISVVKVSIPRISKLVNGVKWVTLNNQFSFNMNLMHKENGYVSRYDIVCFSAFELNKKYD